MRLSPLLSANRYSMVIFFSSIQPSLFISRRNASTMAAIPEALLGSRNPMRKTFPGYCAETGTQSAKSMALKLRTKMCFFICAFSYLTNDLRRPRQYVRWNRNTDLLGSLEIDHELELRRLLDGQFSGLGSLQDSVHVIREARVAVRLVCPVEHKPADIYGWSAAVYRRQTVLQCEIRNPFLVSNHQRPTEGVQSVRALLGYRGKNFLETIRRSDLPGLQRQL